ncbi:ankyrin protein [Fusarium heterosporum]|uniref:Ankyrin protein n=1 Tax=Fusarium heterosporum TaxID=42747 RepID=A0A8H5T4I4_FUSHE|nr:ankyrin protein [Fusarium heterosporum]
MDPLSLAASIAGLISLAGAVISAGYKLSSKINADTNDTKTLVNETATFSGILLGVEKHLRSLHPAVIDLSAAEKVAKDSEITLKEIEELVKKLSTANRLEMLIKAGGREELAVRLLRRIEQYKLFFILCFQLEHSAKSATLQNDMANIMIHLESLKETQKEVEKSVGKLVDTKELEQQEKIIRWLGSVTETEHDDLCKQRDASSAEWILNRDEFGAWLSSPASAFFWLNGTQGSGKSVVVSKIIHVIQDTILEPGTSVLAYHYCRFSNPSSLSPNALIGAFIGQLLKQSASSGMLMGSVNELYEKYRRRSSHPSLEDLQTTFIELCQYFGRIFLVVDGLDEMEDRWSILEFLETLSGVDGDFKVLIASRAEMGLEDAFSYYFQVTINPQDIAPDIERFVRKQLSRRRFRGSEVEAVVKVLVDRADGMFLWVICQLDHLFHVRTAITPSLVKALPGTLEKTFEQTFLKLDEEERRLAKRILQFVMFSNAPLDLSELVEGIAITSETRTLDDVKFNSLREKKYVFELCGSLIRESRTTGKIELAHYSVYSFLKSPLLEGNRPNGLYLEQTDGNIKLLLASIRYLSMEDIATGGLPEEIEDALGEDDLYVSPEVFTTSPFLEHAISNWPAYVASLTEDDLKKIWRSVLHPFFQTGSSHFKFWASKARYIYGQYKYPRGMTPLHATALHGLADLAKLLMKDNSFTIAVNGIRTPLHMAIENGKDSMVEMFLDAKFTQSVDEKGRTPLHLALECADELAVIQLFSVGADVNLCEKDGRTPLFIAIENNWEDIAPQLSEMADPSVTMPDGRGPLHLAAQTGSMTWTTALLEAHTSILDNVDERGWSPLHFAADRGHSEVVKTLLSKGACRGIRDKHGWTPLHAAMKNCHLDCATQILTSRNRRQPALWEAGRSGSNQQEGGLVGQREDELRRKYGDSQGQRRSERAAAGEPSRMTAQNVGASSSSAGLEFEVPSPLFLAVSNKSQPGVELLLRHAETYGRHEVGLLEEDGACLKKSILLSKTTIFKALLSASTVGSIVMALPSIASDTDQDLQVVFRQTLDANFAYIRLLPKVISSKSVNLSHTILDLWPSQDSKLPHNILLLASRCTGDESQRLVTRLIDQGADLRSVDDEGNSPLRIAITNKNLHVAYALLLRVPTDDAMLLSTLHDLIENAPIQDDAVESQAFQILNLLLEKGVEVHGMDKSGRTICHKAAARIDTAFLIWALEHNVEPLAFDSRGDTAVSVAVGFQQHESLELLLNHIIQTVPEDIIHVLAKSGVRGSPLKQAIGLSNVTMLNKLIEANQMAESLSEDDSTERKKMQQAIFTDGLCDAIRGHFDHAALLLIEAMADISAQSSTGETPLHVAVRQGNESIVTMLLENEAKVNVEDLKTKETPYGIATLTNSTNIKALLRQYGAEPLPQDIRAAAKAGDEGLLEKILAKHPHDSKDKRKALFTARHLRHKQFEKKLQEWLATNFGRYKIDTIPRDVYGDTVLHRAVRARNPDQLYLLGRGCDRALLHAYDLGGDSALMLAIRMCHWRGAEVLALEGANIDEALEKSRSENCPTWVAKLEELKTKRLGY